MKIELPRNEALLASLEERGDHLSHAALAEIQMLYSVRDDYFEQLIEQCDRIDELEGRLGDA